MGKTKLCESPSCYKTIQVTDGHGVCLVCLGVDHAVDQCNICQKLAPQNRRLREKARILAKQTGVWPEFPCARKRKSDLSSTPRSQAKSSKRDDLFDSDATIITSDKENVSPSKPGESSKEEELRRVLQAYSTWRVDEQGSSEEAVQAFISGFSGFPAEIVEQQSGQIGVVNQGGSADIVESITVSTGQKSVPVVPSPKRKHKKSQKKKKKRKRHSSSSSASGSEKPMSQQQLINMMCEISQKQIAAVLLAQQAKSQTSVEVIDKVPEVVNPVEKVISEVPNLLVTNDVDIEKNVNMNANVNTEVVNTNANVNMNANTEVIPSNVTGQERPTGLPSVSDRNSVLDSSDDEGTVDESKDEFKKRTQVRADWLKKLFSLVEDIEPPPSSEPLGQGSMLFNEEPYKRRVDKVPIHPGIADQIRKYTEFHFVKVSKGRKVYNPVRVLGNYYKAPEPEDAFFSKVQSVPSVLIDEVQEAKTKCRAASDQARLVPTSDEGKVEALAVNKVRLAQTGFKIMNALMVDLQAMKNIIKDLAAKLVTFRSRAALSLPSCSPDDNVMVSQREEVVGTFCSEVSSSLQSLTEGLGDTFRCATDEFKVHVNQFIEGSVDRRKAWLDASSVPPALVKEMGFMPIPTFSKVSSEPLDLLGTEATARLAQFKESVEYKYKKTQNALTVKLMQQQVQKVSQNFRIPKTQKKARGAQNSNANQQPQVRQPSQQPFQPQQFQNNQYPNQTQNRGRGRGRGQNTRGRGGNPRGRGAQNVNQNR